MTSTQGDKKAGTACWKGPPQTYATATDACEAAQQQIDTTFVEFTPCASSKPRQKALLGRGAAAGDACGKDRTGPILFGVRLRCSQSHLGRQPVRTSDKMADRAELLDAKMARRIDLY